MDKPFEILKVTRNNILKSLNGLSDEELNTVPDGFGNSIIWNAAHVLVTQQLLCYKLSENELSLPDNFIDRFKKGTKADKPVSKDLIEYIKDQLLHLTEKLEEDYKKGIFKEYSEYETSFGVTLRSIDDAIIFNNTHEALHLGYIMAQRKSLL